MTVTTAFEPRWASAPGSTILEALRGRGLTVDDLADGLGLSDPEVRRLLTGDMPFERGLAEGIASVVGGSIDFWLARDKQFRESKSLLSAEALADQLPFKQMVDWGWLPPAATWREQTARILEYFGVADGVEWNDRYRDRIEGAHYRSSPSIPSTEASVAAWLRQVEIQAQKQPATDWHPEQAESAISAVRAASRIGDPAIFIPLVRDALAPLGVTFVLVRAPLDCALSGAALATSDRQRVIAVTARHLSDDHLFFTVFHELGHHLLHGDSLFLDEFEDSDRSQIEMEADRFAASAMIPEGLSSLEGRQNGPTMRMVIAFSAHVGVAPGIVVGQLQHTGILGYNQLNRLKRRYAWDGLTLKSARRP